MGDGSLSHRVVAVDGFGPKTRAGARQGHMEASWGVCPEAQTPGGAVLGRLSLHGRPVSFGLSPSSPPASLLTPWGGWAVYLEAWEGLKGGAGHSSPQATPHRLLGASSSFAEGETEVWRGRGGPEPAGAVRAVHSPRFSSHIPASPVIS